MSNRSRLCALWLAVVLMFSPSVSIFAEEPEPQPAAPTVAATAQKKPPPATPQSKQPDAEPAREHFDPSEKISEDLSVSFPSDI